MRQKRGAGGNLQLVGDLVKIKLRFSVGLCVHYRAGLILGGGRWRNSEVPLERGACSPVGRSVGC